MKKAMFLTPVVTAFTKNGKIDIEGNKRIWDHLIKGGMDGIVLMGNTGRILFYVNASKKRIN